MEASNVTGLLFSQLNFRGERQKVISSNIANIDTPNYKTKDLVFEHELNKVKEPRLQLAQTTNNHIPNVNPMRNLPNPRLVEVQGLQ